MTASAFDLASVRQTLRHMLDHELLTLENLDEPSPGFNDNLHVDPRIFPKGYRGVRFQNLLRNPQDLTPEDF